MEVSTAPVVGVDDEAEEQVVAPTTHGAAALDAVTYNYGPAAAAASAYVLPLSLIHI